MSETSILKIVSLVALLCTWLSVDGQVAEVARIAPANQRAACSGNMDAGTIRAITPLQAESFQADLRPPYGANSEPIYLCYNDIIFIDHNGDADLAGDPDPSTQGGIGYQYYSAPPLVSGETTTDLLNENPRIIQIKTDIPFNSWIAKQLPTGDAYFQNLGQVQDQFYGRNPGKMWFAPITLSDFDEGLLNDNCLNVATSEAFSIVYLNEIQVQNFVAPEGMLTGSFSIRGGLPEWERDKTYRITMVHTMDPTAEGTINESATHDGSVTFDVPKEGSYLISVTDGMGCTYSVIRTVPSPSSADPVRLCLGDSTIDAGEQFCVPITVEDFVGVGGYQFSVKWDPNVLEFARHQSVNPLAANTFAWNDNDVDQGIFSALFFDNGGGLVSVNDAEALFELCFTAVGDPGDRTSLDFSSAPSLDISVSTDVAGIPFETKNGSVTITPPELVGIFKEEICATNGGIQVNFSVFGGTGPYTYELFNTDLVMLVQSGPVATSGSTIMLGTNPILPPAEYELRVTDVNNVQAVKRITGNLLNPVTYDLFASNPSCPESNDGYIKIENLVSNGTTNQYNWLNLLTGEQRFGTDSIGRLGTGKWRATVTDANGCFDDAIDSVEAQELVVDFNVLSQPSCNGVADGVLNATAQGTGDFEYTWYDENDDQIGNTATSSSGSSKSNLADGLYYVEVEIPGGQCPAERASQRLLPAKELEFTIDPSTTTQVTCNGMRDGRIQLTTSAAMNDLREYTFDWSTLGSGTSLSSDFESTATDLGPGTYQLTVTERSGAMCSKDTTFIIAEPAPLDASLAQPTQPSCPDGMDGFIDYGFFNGPTGGTPFQNGADYLVFWNGIGRDGNRRSFETLPAGEYPVVLEDANGCRDTMVWVLTSGPTIEIDATAADLTCIGDQTASLDVTGDITGHEIMWSTGETTNRINNLGSGTYVVTVTETLGNGDVCPSTDTFEILEPVFPLTVTRPMQFVSSSGCREDPDGRIFNMGVSGAGGRTDWHFTGPGVDTIIERGPNLFIDSSGTYFYDIINFSNGCVIYSDSISAIFPEPIVVSIDTLDPSCFSRADGEVSLELSRPSTGSTQFSVNWSTGDSDPNVTTSSITALDSGTYVYTILDVLDPSCILVDSITIDDPAPLEISIDTMDSRLDLCFGDDDGRIRITRTGGNNDAAPTIQWSHDATLQGLLAEDLSAATYRIDFTDNRGCSDDAEIVISQLDEIEAFYDDPVEPECFGGQTSLMLDQVIGGLPEYSFSVDNGPAQSITDAIPLFAGEHIISVFDAAGCRMNDTIMIDQPEQLSIGLMDEVTVGLGDSVTLDANLAGLAQIDSFIWTPPDLLSCSDCPAPKASPIDDQLFELRVIDVSGCEADGAVMVRVDKARGVYIPNAFSPDNDGRNDSWKVYAGASVRQILSTMIVDRWGNVVYQNDDPEPASPDGTMGWDGKLGNKDLDPAVYLYLVKVEFVDNKSFIYRGDINLIR